MVHQFNHRAASIEVHDENIHNPAISELVDESLLSDPNFFPGPQYWIARGEVDWPVNQSVQVSFRDIARTNDARTFISALIPRAGVGNKLPLIQVPEVFLAVHLVANLNSFVFDFVTRNKLQSTSLNWYIVEQLPVLTPEHYDRRFGKLSAAEIVKDHVLRLTYTAHDMAPFARDMGYVDKDGKVKPPIVWNETERRHLRARLDALYFILYGVNDEDDIRYILSTFPIVERKDREAFEDVYLTRELILWYKRALEAGDPQSLAPETELIRLAKDRRDGPPRSDEQGWTA